MTLLAHLPVLILAALVGLVLFRALGKTKPGLVLACASPLAGTRG